MITELPIDKIIQTSMRFGADFAEVFVEKKKSTNICLDDRRIENASTFSDFGLGIRVLADGKTSYGSTNDLSKRNLLALAKRVGKAVNAKRTDSQQITLNEKDTGATSTVSQHPFGIKLEKKCDIVTRANEAAWSCGDEIKQVKILYRDTVRRILVASSDGVFANDEQVDTVMMTQVIASDGKHIQTGQEIAGGALGFELFEELLPEEMAECAAKRAIRMLHSRGAPAGRMPVIIAGEAGGTMIHEAVGHGLEADLALDGNSVYAEKLGKRVAGDIITVIDDATVKGRRGSFSFDDEGTPAQRTVLIENGILKQYMSDRMRGKQEEKQSTGNSRRSSYREPPIVRMTNTFIAPGNDDSASIVSETPNGLYVRRMGGGQVNTINGDFLFDVQEGYLIENGEIGEPVRGATLTGNGPKVLLQIDHVGNDLGFSIGTCGKEGQDAPVACGQPTIRIPEIVVGGTK